MIERFEIVKGREEIEVSLDRKANQVSVLVCEPHCCYSIDLEKSEVSQLIDALEKFYEDME